MLKMSTKGRYGLRAMIDLAEAYTEDRTPVMMGDIAERQDFSRKYLHAILTSLKQAGLVQAMRGAKGGYFLARPPNTIKISDILVALEGNLSIVDCVYDDRACKRQTSCAARTVWQDLNRSIFNLLEDVTLNHLIHSHRRKKEKRNGKSRE
jgi:Rrf2 family protein